MLNVYIIEVVVWEELVGFGVFNYEFDVWRDL